MNFISLEKLQYTMGCILCSVIILYCSHTVGTDIMRIIIVRLYLLHDLLPFTRTLLVYIVTVYVLYCYNGKYIYLQIYYVYCLKCVVLIMGSLMDFKMASNYTHMHTHNTTHTPVCEDYGAILIQRCVA